MGQTREEIMKCSATINVAHPLGAQKIDKKNMQAI